jgi:hypothetical protein
VVEGKELAYWRPQVMRHVGSDGRIEYAFHDVYFAGDGSMITYTLAARSVRRDSVAELEAWVRDNLERARDGIVCGDLGYVHSGEYLALWLDHVHDPPIQFESYE